MSPFLKSLVHKKEHYSNFCAFEIASLLNVPGHYLRKYGILNLKLFCHFPGILLPYLWIQISPEMCRWSAQVMPAGQDPKSSCTGVSLFFDFLICVNCVSFCYFFLKGWSSAMKHRDSHDPSYFTLMSLYERFTKERYLKFILG